MEEKKAVLWDLGQVVVKVQPGAQIKAIGRALNVSVQKLAEFIYLERAPGSSLTMWEEMETRGSACDIYELFVKRFDPNLETNYYDFVQAMNTGLIFPTEETDELIAIMRRLKAAGVVQGILSNIDAIHAAYFEFLMFRARPELETIFPKPQRFYSQEIHARKGKTPEAFLIACDRMGVKPENAALIDDLPPNIRGVNSCGGKGILYTGPEGTLKKLMGFEFLPRY